MDGLDRAFVLGVALQLQDGDVEKIVTAVEKKLNEIPALKLKIDSLLDLERLAQTAQRVTEATKTENAEVTKLARTAKTAAEETVQGEDTKQKAVRRTRQEVADAAAERKTQRETERAEKQKAQDLDKAWKALLRDEKAQQAAINTEIERGLGLLRERNTLENIGSLIKKGRSDGRSFFGQSANYAWDESVPGVTDKKARQLTQADVENRNSGRAPVNTDQLWTQWHAQTTEGIQNFKQQLHQMAAAGPIDEEASAMERRTAAINRYLPRLQAAITQQAIQNRQLPESIRNYHTFADELVNDAGKVAMWTAATSAIFGTMHTFQKGFTDAMHVEKQQAIAQLYAEAQNGKPASPEQTSTKNEIVLNEAIAIARMYGAEIAHVVENIGVWQKVTKGDLNAAILMANESTKMATISGMNLNEVYRSTTAALAQMHEPLRRTKDLYAGVIEMAMKYGGGIQSLEGESQDTARQILEGIDRSAAILSKGGMGMAEMGAAVAVLNTVVNESGESLATHLSAGFAALLEGKPRAKMAELGIEVQNNKHLVEDLAKNWKELGSFLAGQGSGMRQADKEVITALIDRVKMYGEAKASFQKAMKDSQEGRPLQDHAVEVLMGTTQFQYAQVKANIEAASISIAKSFLPNARAAAEVLNTELLPRIIANREGITRLAHDYGLLALAIGGGIAFKAFIAQIARATMDAKAFTMALQTTAGGYATFEAAEATAMTAYQRNLLAAASTTGTTTVEMETAVKVMAVRYGISIDQVILKLLELRGVESKVAQGTELDMIAMGASTATLARTVGVEAAAIEGQFIGIESAASTMSRNVGIAFARMIPILGWGLTGVMFAAQARDYLEDRKKEHYDKDMQDPKKRHDRIAELDRQDAELTERRVSIEHSINNKPHWDKNLHAWITDPGRTPTSTSESSDLNAAHVENRSEKNRLQHFGDEDEAHRKLRKSRDDAIAERNANMARMKKEWAHAAGLDTVPGGAGKPLTDDLAVKAKKNGDSTEAGRQASGAKELNDALKHKIDLLDILLKADDRAIARAEYQIRLWGDQGKALSDLEAAFRKKISDEQTFASQEMTNASEHRARAAKLEKASIDAGGIKKSQGLTLHNEALTQLRLAQEAEDKALDARNRVLDLQSQIAQRMASATMKLQQQLFDSNPVLKTHLQTLKALHTTSSGKYHTDTDLESEAKENERVGRIYDLESQGATSPQLRDSLAQKAQDYRNAAAQLRQKVEDDKQSAELLRESVKDQIQALTIEAISPYDAPLAKALSDANAMQQTYVKDSWQYTVAGNVEGQKELDIWRQKKLAIIEAAFELGEYERRKATYEKTLTAQLVDKTLSSVGTTVGKDLLDNVDGDNKKRQQYQTLEAQISWLEQQKALLVGQQYNTQRSLIESQVKALQQRVKDLKDLEAHPGFIKSIMKDIEKSAIDATLKKAEDSLKQSIMDAIIGPKPKTEMDKQRDALDKAQKALTNIIRDDNNSYANVTNRDLQRIMIDDPDSYANTTKKALAAKGNGGSGSTPSATAVIASNPTLSGDLLNTLPKLLTPAAIAAGVMATSGVAAYYGGGVNPGTYVEGGGGSKSGSDKPYGSTGNLLLDAFGKGGKVEWNKLGTDLGFKNNTGHLLAQAGGAWEAYQGYQQGGAGGAMEAAQGAYSATGNPYVAAAAALVAFFHKPKDRGDATPDVHDWAHYGQWNSDMQGVTGVYDGHTVGPESQYDVLHGGKSLEQQIAEYASNKSNWNDKNDTQKAELQRILDLEGGQGVKGLEIVSTHEGIDTLGSGQQISVKDYQSISGDISDMIAKSLTANGGALAPIMSFNAYGGSGRSSLTASGGLYNTPGMNSGDLKAYLAGTPYAVNPGVDGPTGPGAQQQQAPTVNVQVTAPVYLDGYKIYENTTAYARQRGTMGYDPMSN